MAAAALSAAPGIAQTAIATSPGSHCVSYRDRPLLVGDSGTQCLQTPI